MVREAATRPERVEHGNDHNGCNGCTRRSLAFAAVRSLDPKPLQTGGFSEHERTGANARQPLPCRRSWVRVPSSALLESPKRGSLFEGAIAPLFVRTRR